MNPRLDDFEIVYDPDENIHRILDYYTVTYESNPEHRSQRFETFPANIIDFDRKRVLLEADWVDFDKLEAYSGLYWINFKYSNLRNRYNIDLKRYSKTELRGNPPKDSLFAKILHALKHFLCY